VNDSSWECEKHDNQIVVFKITDAVKNEVGFYNLIKKETCSKCGNPYFIQTSSGSNCKEDYLHEKLIYAKGVFQIGHYFSKRVIDRRNPDDILNNHIWNLKHNGDYAEPLGKAMYLVMKEHPELFEADILVPMPEYVERFNQNTKARALATQLQKLMKNDKFDVEVIDAIRKVKDITTHKLRFLNEREDAVEGMYQFNKEVSVHDKKIILIDDMLTAGNNKGACCKLLTWNGAKKVWILVSGRNY